MAMMMMMQQQQQAQQQQAQMQQLKQQEEENKRIQQEMEALLRTQDNSKVDYQRRELQKIMREVSSQVSNLVTHAQPALPHTYAPPQRRQASSDNTALSGDTATNPVVTEDELRTLSMLPKESELYRIQLDHLASVTKVKFEMEKLTQEQRLFELKQDLERKKAEHKKEMEHDEFMAEKRRQLRAARIQRILAQEMPTSNGGTREYSYDYDPNFGFTFFFDFALDLPRRFQNYNAYIALQSCKSRKQKYEPFQLLIVSQILRVRINAS